MASRCGMTVRLIQMQTVVGLMMAVLGTLTTPYSSPGRILCGQQLADTLDMVCSGRGFHWRKRSVAEAEETAEVQEKRSMFAGVRQGPSVVDECCRQGPCTFQILESYCASGEDGTSSNAEFNLMSIFNDHQTTTASMRTTTTTLSSSRSGTDSPVAEIVRGPSWRQPKKQFFYLPVTSRPTRTPLILD